MTHLAHAQLTRPALESRRLQACARLAAGIRPSKVAAEFQVSRTTALRWRDMLAADQDLHSRKATGRPARLTAAQRQQVLIAFERGVSGKDLAEFLEQRFGVRYCEDHLYRLMTRLGIPRAKAVTS